MLEAVRNFLEHNSLIVLIFLVLSLAANLFEITGYFRERTRRREEQRQRHEDEKRLKVYEFLFEAAEKNIKTGAALDALQSEIARRQNAIPQLEKRIELLQLAAKKEIVAQNLARAVEEVRSSYDRLRRTRELHASLGELPDLPSEERMSIAAEIEKNTQDPYQLPAAVMYRCLLLVLIVMLLPSPADSLLIVVLLGLFLRTFFDVATLSVEPGFRQWVMNHWRMLGWLSCFGAWFGLLQSAEMYLARPLDILVDQITDSIRLAPEDSGWLLRLLVRRSYLIGQFIILGMSIVLGSLHWKRSSAEIARIVDGDVPLNDPRR